MRRVVKLSAVVLAVLLLAGCSSQEETEPLPTATLPIRKPTAQSGAGGDGSTLVRVAMPDGTVSSLTMAEYLWRVAAAEMPASFETEALRAQAVTARTYTLYQMSIGQNPNHPDADMCTDVSCCQAYLSPEDAAANWGDQAQIWGKRSPGRYQIPTDRLSFMRGSPSTPFSSPRRRDEPWTR